MTLDFSSKRWAIYGEVHNLRTADPQAACYWTGPCELAWTGKNYGWGTFNGACDPLDLGEAHTFAGALAAVLRSVWHLKRD